jgi:hypothetical protein
MNDATDSVPAPALRRWSFWALVPVALLAASTSGLLVMASIAKDDPGFALESNYYERAVRWDRQQLQSAENARLGYRVELEAVATRDAIELHATPFDRAGARLEGCVLAVDAFANARAADVRHLTLQRGADGTHRASLGAARPGLWEFRFNVLRNGERFTQTVRLDVPGLPVTP